MDIKQAQTEDFGSTYYRFSDEITEGEGRKKTFMELSMLSAIERMSRAITLLKRNLSYRKGEIAYLRRREVDAQRHIESLNIQLSKANNELKQLKKGGNSTVEKKTAKAGSAPSLQWLYEATSR